MTNTVERFSGRVADYVKYRPGYPAEVLDLFRTEMNLEASSTIADIGSGTGISAKIFLENGNKVFGVEPNEAMRRAAVNFLKEFSEFENVDGVSENTTLENNSVDFVVAAQAFHWFNRENTRQEFKRILKDAGFVALIWNERQLDSTPFLHGYERLLIEFGTDYTTVRHDNVDRKALQNFFQTNFDYEKFLNVQTVDFEGLKGRMLSSSYIPTAENPRFGEMLEKLETLFAERCENDRIEILYDTKVFYAQI